MPDFRVPELSHHKANGRALVRLGDIAVTINAHEHGLALIIQTGLALVDAG
jgi:hypothetical protein